MSSSVITQEIHVVKRVLSKTVRDLICQKVEETINNAPSSFTKEEWEHTFKKPSHSLLIEKDRILNRFKTIMYDDTKTNRMVSFKQFGTFYIMTVWVKENNVFNYLAFSLYDIVEWINHDEYLDEVSYIFVSESTNLLDYEVTVVNNPQDYLKDAERHLISENNKSIISFPNDGANQNKHYVIYCSPSIITVSQAYDTDLTPIEVSKNLCGTLAIDVTPNAFGSAESVYGFSYKDDELTVNDVFIDEKFLESENSKNFLNFAKKISQDGTYEIDGYYVTTSDYKTEFVKTLSEIPLHDGLNSIIAVLKFNPFVKEYSAGTVNYGLSSDGIDQNQNQNKINISVLPNHETRDTKVTLSVKEGEILEKWTSTNPVQQDVQHEWYALNFKFDASRFGGTVIGNVSWNDYELTSEDMDIAEGKDIITLWLKLDVVREKPVSVKIKNLETGVTETTIIELQ